MTRSIYRILAALVAAVALPTFAQEPLAPDAAARTVIDTGGRVDFVFGDDRPFAECHASTLVQTQDGTLLSAWFGGTEEKDPDVGIWFSRFEDGAWAAPTRIAKVNETAHWNPVLFNEGPYAYLFFKIGPEIPHWQTYWMISGDNGKTWTEPAELVTGDHGGRGPVKNKLIVLSDGAWLAGASTELGDWIPFFDRSEDKGRSWTRTDDIVMDKDAIPGKGAIQPTLWESKPGHVHALMRTAMGKAIRTDSTDGGRTWTAARVTDVPNNNSGLDVLKLDDGRLLMLYNPVGKNWGPRTPLSLGLSTDNGDTWRVVANLEDTEGEYSYPAIVETQTGLALCYTWKRERVRAWQITDAGIEALTK